MAPDDRPLCEHCGRPLRPALRGFCARCVTTPRQRRKLGVLSPDAMGSEGPFARAMDIVFGVVVLGVAVAGTVVLAGWIGWLPALGALLVLAVLAAVGFL